MLDTIPPEILGQIAYHLSSETLQPPVNLLLTSRHFERCLSPTSNPNFYARIFREHFDISAASRRLGREPDGAALTRELERRAGALSRLRVRDVSDLAEEDLWTLYLLVIEHDRRNLNHLFTPTFNVLQFLKRFADENLLAAAFGPGYPTESVGRSLLMWIAWTLHTYGIGREEKSEEKGERMFILRPFVFAAHKYAVYYGPWTIHDLPLSTSRRPQPLDPRFEGHPFLADLSPKSRGVQIEYYGRKIMLSPPMLSHAAILRFFKRERDEDIDADEDDEDDESGVLVPHFRAFGLEAHSRSSQTIPPSGPSPNETLSVAATQTKLGQAIPTTKSPLDNPVLVRLARQSSDLSSAHDRDWSRLTRCYDPSNCPGMRVRDWRNAFSGCWEGNFSFFEFEAFKEMIGGNSRALYEGPFGQQAQVWRITETFVWPKRPRPSNKPSAGVTNNASEGGMEESHEASSSGKDKGKEKEVGHAIPLNGPATNAGFPTELPASTNAGLATPSAEQITLNETIKQQLEAIEGYEVVPSAELDGAIERDEPGLEVLLTGTGHSAWGRFILKGRVRTWDGMATLVKEYAPDSRGKWVYRGYVTAGDVMVGRWRDTFTPEEFIGYEGTFILNRRE